MRARAAALFCVSAILGFAGCAISDVPIEHSLRDGLATCFATPGLDGLHVYLYVDGGWRDYASGKTGTPSAPQIERVSRNDPGLDAASVNFRDRFPDQAGNVPMSGRERLLFPAAYSPNKRFFVAAVGAGSKGVGTELLLRTERDRRIAAIAGFHFENLVWSPDSRLIAVLEKRIDSRPRSFRALVAPHGVQYDDVVLTVIDTRGTPICQAALVEKRPDVSTRLEWNGRASR
jgi:hypothetical protein